MHTLWRISLFSTILLVTLFSVVAPAQAHGGDPAADEIFESRVTAITDEVTKTAEDGAVFVQQNLELEALTGPYDGQTFTFTGIGDFEVVDSKQYRVGDRVVTALHQTPDGEPIVTVIDYVRRGWLWALAALFAASVLVISRWKGLRALLVIVLSFAVILGVMIPLILQGMSPLLVSIIGATAIMTCAIFITEGVNTKSLITFAAVIASLVVILILSTIFTGVTRLTGLWNEDILYLISYQGQSINAQGLLLAGIVIGSIGALDDIIVSQVSAVQELYRANKQQSVSQIFSAALRIGTDHISALVNTLFLAYAGVALPLLLLFAVDTGTSVSWLQLINNELIATEIVRTLVGSIGLVLAMPLSTWLAIVILRHYPAALDTMPEGHHHHHH